MAIQASREGGSMPTVFNAANELAVKKFLEEKIGFLDIYEIIAQSMERHKKIAHPDLCLLYTSICAWMVKAKMESHMLHI